MLLTKISAMQTTLLNFINKPKKLNLRFLASFLLIGCLFSVNLNAQTGNRGLLAYAGSNQTIDCAPLTGTLVTLDGSGSTNTVNYTWRENRSIIAFGINPTITLLPGTHTISLVIDNGAGVYSTNNSVVTITVNTDTTAPTIVTKPTTVYLDALGNANISTFDIDGGTTDNCNPVTLSLDKTTFSCANLGSNFVTLTGTDASGNTASAQATVTVIDNIAPTVIAQNFTVDLDDTGSATIVATDIDGGSSDNCSFNLTLDKTDFTCANIGANIVTLTGTDASGNTASAQATVTVSNLTSPMVIAKYLTIYLDESGLATIVPSDIDAGSFYNCGLTLSLDITDFTCANLGQNLVTLTGTDPFGNATIAQTIVTVVDNLAPVITCPADITVTSTSALGAIVNYTAPVGTDNCSANTALTAGLASGSVFPIGTTVVTHTITDASGNTASCSFNVTVTQSPVSCNSTIVINPFTAVTTQKPNTIFLGYGPQTMTLSTQTTGGTGFIYSWTSSTGEVVANVANPTINPKVSTTYTVIATNADGCLATASIYVCVIDARAIDKYGKYKGKVLVCHNEGQKSGRSHTIEISVNAVLQHLTLHLDTLGACDATCATSYVDVVVDNDDDHNSDCNDDDDDHHNSHAGNDDDDDDDDHESKCEDKDDDDDHNNHSGDEDHHSKSKGSETKAVVYPNPVDDDFVIGLNKKGEGSVEIYNNKGTRIYKKGSKDLKQGVSINMRGKKSGTYFARVICKGKVYTVNIYKK